VDEGKSTDVACFAHLQLVLNEKLLPELRLD
jgi:hypothetical protein